MSKYRKGRMISDPLEAIALILDRKPIYWNHKCQNSGWMQNYQINVIATAVRRGIIFHAIRREQEA